MQEYARNVHLTSLTTRCLRLHCTVHPLSVSTAGFKFPVYTSECWILDHMCNGGNHARRTASQNQIFCVRVQQWMCKQPPSVRLCPCIVLRSEAQTFSCRNKKKNKFLTGGGLEAAVQTPTLLATIVFKKPLCVPLSFYLRDYMNPMPGCE